MKNLLIHASVLFTVFFISACNSPKPVINELSNTTSTYDETIRINNCDNKAESSQTVSRSFSTKISGTGTIKAGYEGIVEGSVAATYEQYKNTTKIQTLTAAPDTNMEFTLRWSDNVRSGNVTVSGESAEFTVNIPIAVEQISSRDLGCNTSSGSTESSTPNQNNTNSIAGNWAGTFIDDGASNQLKEEIEMFSGCTTNEVCGKLTLPELPCYADLKLLSVDNNTFMFEEINVSGADFCVPGGQYTIQLLSDGTISRRFKSSDGSISSQGTLTKQ